MNEEEVIKRHYARIGAKGGRLGRGESKRREGSAENLRKYWEDVRNGLREPPKRRGRPRKKQEVRPVAQGEQPVVRGGQPVVRGEQPEEEDVTAEKWVVVDSVGDLVRVGRNEPCPCGSGKKYKKCHGFA